jgi:hypothetical protein
MAEEIEVKEGKMLNTAEIKKIAKASGKRVGKDFIVAFANLQRKQLEACINEHNAGKKTLDAGVLHYVCGKK